MDAGTERFITADEGGGGKRLRHVPVKLPASFTSFIRLSFDLL